MEKTDRAIHLCSRLQVRSVFEKYCLCSLKCNYIGIGVQWVGFYDESMAWNNSIAYYVIDSQPLVPFGTTPAIDMAYYQVVASSRPIISWQSLFISNQLKYGNHSLHIAFNASARTTPLTLQCIVIQAIATAEKPQSTLITNSTTVPSQPRNATTPQNQHTDNGSIAIATSIGSVSFVLAILVLYVFIRKRQGQRAEKHVGESQMSEHLAPHPFPIGFGHNHTTISPRKATASLQGYARSADPPCHEVD